MNNPWNNPTPEMLLKCQLESAGRTYVESFQHLSRQDRRTVSGQNKILKAQVKLLEESNKLMRDFIKEQLGIDLP